MFYEAMLINEKESTLFPLTQVTGAMPEPTNYTTISITGLDQPRSQLNMTKVANLDGALFNSATVDTRNIVIMIKIKSQHESIRNLINNICPINDLVKLYYFTGSNNYTIEGYVESVSYNLFDKSQIAQISLICPNPNFKVVASAGNDYEEVTLGYQSDGHFKYTHITTNSPFELGFKVEIAINTNATLLNLSKYYDRGSCYMTYSGEILSGDKIIFNCYKTDFSIVRKRIDQETGIDQKTVITQDFARIDFFQLSPQVDNLVSYSLRNESDYVANLATAKLYYQNEVRGI